VGKRPRLKPMQPIITTPRASNITIRRADGSVEVVSPHAFAKMGPARSHRDARRRPHWKKMRKKALHRDGYRCVDCRQARDELGAVPLEVHHLTYVRMGVERLEDLVTLCQRCHGTRHKWLNATPAQTEALNELAEGWPCVR
jgi:5-methylcytosine-specific restriction endonuclease McrA